MFLTQTEYELILRRDLMSFFERSFYELNPQTPLIIGPHIEMMASKLEACRHGKIRRLIINLPPRNLKSHCSTIAFVAWWLGHNPAGHVICASYGQDLADKLARDCRSVMLSSWYQRLFPTRLLQSRQAAHDFTTTAQGTRLATSVGGVLTGRGADMILIDDPLKPDDALSEPRRKAVNEWYDNTLLSRLNDKAMGCIIIVMQRLHQDDLVGHVLEQEPWDILSFPAIAEQDETHVIESVLGTRLFTRRAGEALHSQRETLQTLAGIRQSMTEYNFAAQYQQNPLALGGAIVKTTWLKYYEPNELPDRFYGIVQSWDTANKATDLSDFSVCTTWGARDGRFYLLDVFRRRLNYPELKRAARELAHRYRPTSILIEDKASGTPLAQELRSDGIVGIKPYEPPAGTDKIMRLHLQTALFENGHVLLPRHALWLPDYVAELTGFPGTKFDDQVDSTTQALQFLKEGKDMAEKWARFGRSFRASLTQTASTYISPYRNVFPYRWPY
jgi:predicted phage terminase large subunit-like protein